jgi:HlyD family secretion protein
MIDTIPSAAACPSLAALQGDEEEARDAARPRHASRIPALLLAAIFCALIAASVWYLALPQPLLVQGESDATRTDIAARVDGRVATIPVDRGDNVTAGGLLMTIENPELLAKLAEARAAKTVADAQLARINAGTRAEQIAQQKAGVDKTAADLKLAQQTYDRTQTLVASGHAPVQRLDENAAQLEVARRANEQARLALEEGLNGYTREEHEIAEANVGKAAASIATLQASVYELTIRAPSAGQIYERAAEPGEYVTPGVPLLSIVDLGDIWFSFDLREDLLKGRRVGDRFEVRVPALGDQPVEVEIKTIASRGEYSGWRATRATGDFDLRTFEIRAYPVAPLPNLRPGMSAYANWPGAR